jgi:hypothetical protein
VAAIEQQRRTARRGAAPQVSQCRPRPYSIAASSVVSLLAEGESSVAVSVKSAPYQWLAESSPQAAVVSKVSK